MTTCKGQEWKTDAGRVLADLDRHDESIKGLWKKKDEIMQEISEIKQEISRTRGMGAAFGVFLGLLGAASLILQMWKS